MDVRILAYMVSEWDRLGYVLFLPIVYTGRSLTYRYYCMGQIVICPILAYGTDSNNNLLHSK